MDTKKESVNKTETQCSLEQPGPVRHRPKFLNFELCAESKYFIKLYYRIYYKDRNEHTILDDGSNNK